MKRAIFLGLCYVLISSCGGSADQGNKNSEAASQQTSSENPSYDPNRGVGKFKNVEVPANLNTPMADNGKKIFDVKCSSCHKLTGEKLVGPGWEGVTKRKTVDWIMNFVTNTDEMLSKDPEAQAQLEICLVRMPNQNLSDDDARSLYEFMRRNDGVK